MEKSGVPVSGVIRTKKRSSKRRSKQMEAVDREVIEGRAEMQKIMAGGVADNTGGKLEVLVSFEEGNWLYKEFIKEFLRELESTQSKRSPESDVKMIMIFRIHCLFNRLDGADEMKKTSLDIQNFFYFHRITLSRKMTEFKKIIGNIFDKRRLVERNVISRIKNQPGSFVENTSTEEIACRRAERLFNELLLYGITLRKKNALKWALAILMGRMLGLGRECLSTLKFDDLPTEENWKLSLSSKNVQSGQPEKREIELTECTSQHLIFLRKVILQLVAEENTNIERVSVEKVLRNQGRLKPRQKLGQADEFWYEDAFRYQGPFKQNVNLEYGLCVFEGYRKHPNALFDALYNTKVTKFPFSWQSFYNSSTSDLKFNPKMGHGLMLLNLAKENQQVYLTDRSVRRVRKAISNYGPTMDYFNFELFCRLEPNRDFGDRLGAKYSTINKSLVLMKTFDEEESKADQLKMGEDIQTPKAMKRIFGTPKKMNLRSRNAHTNRQTNQSDLGEGESEDASNVDDEIFTECKGENSDAEQDNFLLEDNRREAEINEESKGPKNPSPLEINEDDQSIWPNRRTEFAGIARKVISMKPYNGKNKYEKRAEEIVESWRNKKIHKKRNEASSLHGWAGDSLKKAWLEEIFRIKRACGQRYANECNLKYSERPSKDYPIDTHIFPQIQTDYRLEKAKVIRAFRIWPMENWDFSKDPTKHKRLAWNFMNCLCDPLLPWQGNKKPRYRDEADKSSEDKLQAESEQIESKAKIELWDTAMIVHTHDKKIYVTMSELFDLIRFADFLEYADNWCVEVDGCWTPVHLLRNETIYGPVTRRGNPWFVTTGRIVYERLRDAWSVTNSKSPFEIVGIITSGASWDVRAWISSTFTLKQDATFWNRAGGSDLPCMSWKDNDNHPKHWLWEPWNENWRRYLIYIELLSPEDVHDQANSTLHISHIRDLRRKFKESELEAQLWIARTLLKLWVNISDEEFPAEELAGVYHAVMSSQKCLRGQCNLADCGPTLETKKCQEDREVDELLAATISEDISFSTYWNLLSTLEAAFGDFLDREELA